MRALTLDDVSRCLELAAGRDWAPEALKWRLLLSTGQGFALEAPGGDLAGAVVATPYGGKAAAIGMMLVAAAHEGQGLGRRLMAHALAHVGPVPTLLYATPQGRPLYERLGFVEVDTLHKHLGRVRDLAPAAVPRGLEVRAMTAADLDAVAALDDEAFGAPRPALLRSLWEVSVRACVAVREGRLAGYGLAWPNLDTVMIGPLVASGDEVARALVGELVRGQEGLLRLDLPSRFTAMSAWATSLGLERHPPAPMMMLHSDRAPGRREHLYAVAMHALG
ncbi:GNAT family N-acetyltransferase [Pyxidicoccus fallax]|uniref:GNAT family N-acetyltransferase n=1 Tax=Pyxidicoccus fallax TaxID=394095 RepID=A0A848LQH1_9BACT|nr:GNAT family N-acetyltransferase [Pyxidicoccus fallax]NMO19951.1 GNAT family N-acetyltransferase [Pyxidicoccus fallax]NPC80563.1 GNAT family N-acetyltransferase [Pyxidicoccus fallax]